MTLTEDEVTLESVIHIMFRHAHRLPSSLPEVAARGNKLKQVLPSVTPEHSSVKYYEGLIVFLDVLKKEMSHVMYLNLSCHYVCEK